MWRRLRGGSSRKPVKGGRPARPNLRIETHHAQEKYLDENPILARIPSPSARSLTRGVKPPDAHTMSPAAVEAKVCDLVIIWLLMCKYVCSFACQGIPGSRGHGIVTEAFCAREAVVETRP